MQGKLDAQAIQRRLSALDNDLRDMLLARDLLSFLQRRADGKEADAAGGALDIKAWHTEFERLAPDAHYRWLRQQGFSEKEALYIRWGSRNMSDTEQYMKHMFAVFENVKRQGPGSDETTLRALQALPQGFRPKRIMDMGCGAATTSLVLARHTGAEVVALDNHQPFLVRLRELAAAQGLADQVNTQCASMLEPPFEDAVFDLVWSEGSAYIIGFQNALKTWQRLFKPGGCMVISDAVWLTEEPAPALLEFWQREYPDIKDVETRLAQARELGYQVLDSFVMPQEDWDAFYRDLKKSLVRAVKQYGNSPAFDDMYLELDIYKQYRGDYGYAFLVLQPA